MRSHYNNMKTKDLPPAHLADNGQTFVSGHELVTHAGVLTRSERRHVIVVANHR